MTLEDFRSTLAHGAPPPGIAAPLRALWHDGRGEWSSAHEIAQDVPEPDGAWVHAYLHRKEGDASNAAYWYRRARRPEALGPLEQEWEEIVEAFLRRTDGVPGA